MKSKGTGIRSARATAWGLALALFAGVLGQATAATGASRPDLSVTKVGTPFPPTAEMGAPMEIDVGHEAKGAEAPASETGFYLSADPEHDPSDVKVDSVNVRPVGEGERRSVQAVVQPEAPLETGISHVLACADDANRVREANEQNNCAPTPGTIVVNGEAPVPTENEAAPPAAGTSGPPLSEHYPENPGSGMTVDAEFDCPFSLHGQWPSKCVWVTTRALYDTVYKVDEGYNYCPTSHRYPFQVALGFDPLWQDLSDFVLGSAATNAVTGVKYQRTGPDQKIYWSYTGGNDSAQRGYVYGKLTVLRVGGATAKMKYVCSNKKATSWAKP
jgi:hypothetical protein